MVAQEEVGDAAAGEVELLEAGQADEPEVVGRGPVEAAAMGDEDALALQEVQGEELVVMDAEALNVEARENVEGRPGPHGRDAGDVVEQAPDCS